MKAPPPRQECVPKNPGATQPFSPGAASFKDVTAALLFAFTIMPVHVSMLEVISFEVISRLPVVGASQSHAARASTGWTDAENMGTREGRSWGLSRIGAFGSRGQRFVETMSQTDPLDSHTLRVRRTARYYTAGPPPAEARATWFVLHGYGERAQAFATHFAPAAEAGARVVAPEALSRFYTEGTGGAVGASWMTSADREAEIADYLAYLDALAEQELRPAGALHVLGFSQGAATAARWTAHRLAGGHAVQRLTLWAGALPPDVASAAIEDTRLTLVAGTRDAYVTPERLAAQRERLNEAGVAYELLRFEGGHRLDDDTLARLVER